MSRSIRKETSSLAFGIVGRFGGSSAGFVVAALNAASAASREVVVLRVLSAGIYVLALGLHPVKRKLDGHTKACDRRRSQCSIRHRDCCGPKASSLAIWLFSVFRAKFAYETLVHANRFLVPIDFPLSCVNPRAAIPALAMLHLARFQKFKVPSTFSQVLFETVNKVIPDRHDGTLLTSGASGHQPSLSSRRMCPVVK